MLLHLIILLCQVTFAEILQYEITNSVKNEYRFDKACELSGFKHLLLVTAVDSSTIDCMGKKLNAKEFCLNNKGKSQDLVRGFVSNGKLICQHGKSVVLSVKCGGDYQKICTPAPSGCEYFRSLFAYQLEISHSSFFKDENKLNCYFALKSNM